jgi:hypothetical protein
MTPTREELLALAERVKALSEPDREVDCAIGVAAGLFRTEPNRGWPDQLDYIQIREGRDWYPGNGFDHLVPKWTASLDAAMSLVPEGCRIEIEIWPNGRADTLLWSNSIPRDPQNRTDAATPALALTAAALRTLAETAR